MDVKFYSVELVKNDLSYSSMGNLMWGKFEYVAFKNISEFTNEYADKSKNSNNIIYMYSFKDDMRIALREEYGYTNLMFKDLKSDRKYNFVGLTLVSIAESAKKKIVSSHNGKTKFIVEKLDEHLNQKSTKLNNFDNLIYETFGTLNGDDLCFVTLFDDIDIYIQFIEKIQTLTYARNSKEKLFDATYSFVSSPYLSSSSELFKNCNGYASIQITYNFKQSAQYIIGAILEKLELLDSNGKIKDDFKDEVQVYTSLGEYDIVIQLPINKLNSTLYYSLLNSNNKEFYIPNIEQCHTRFFKKNSCDSVYKYNSSNSSDKSNNNNNNNTSNDQEIYQIIEKNMEKLEKALGKNNASNLFYIYNTLSCDFQKASCVIKHDKTMYDDMNMQYKSIINISCALIENYYKNDYKDYIDIYNFALDLIRIFKQTIYRVKQTNMFEKLSAQSLFRDVAVYDKMISCYYYIVKAILSYVYIAGNSNQSSLTPFISFEAVPKVTSELIQVPTDPTEKILSIRLPQEAYYKTHKYIPLLFHELGHYINPRNRKTRNMYLFVIIVTVSLQEYIVCNNPDVNKDKLLHELISGFIKELQNAPDGSGSNTNYYQMFENYDQEKFSSTWDEFCNAIIYIIKEVLTGKTNKISIKYNGITTFISEFFISFTDDYFKASEHKITDDVNSKYEYWEITECYLRSVLMGLREALADTFMMFQVGMTLSEYLALTASVRIDSTLDCKDISELSQVRLGSIFMFTLCSNLDETDENLYGVNENVSDTEIKSLCQNLSKTNEEEISQHLNTIKQSINEYLQVWWPMNRLFRKLLSTVIFLNTDKTLKPFEPFWALLRQEGKLIPDSKKYITWINLSLNQPSLLKLHDIKEKNSKSPEEICEYSKLDNAYIANFNESYKQINVPTIPTYTVNDLENLIPTLGAVNDLLGNNDVLWYRGHASTTWDLKPNMFRKTTVSCNDHIENINNEVAKLMREYNDFVALSAESIELTGNIHTEADWLAYMQHYFIGTNFLDWSEQPLTALYFALENYFDYPCKSSDAELSNCNVIKHNFYKDDMVIWVLNPTRMNLLFHESDIIPNLSIKENADANTQFLLTYKKEKDEDTKKFKMDYIGKHLPKAITTSRISNHIQAQKGHFVAYDIHYAEGDNIRKFNNDDVAYIHKNTSDLAECHQTFFANKKGCHYNPFLAKIIIPYHLKEKTANYVKQMSVSLSTIYPELKNVGIDITKRFNK